MMEGECIKCSKCEGKMDLGFIADYCDKGHFTSIWVQGEPVRKSIFGIEAINLDIRDKKTLPIATMRCNTCGFLESYAI